MAKLPKQVSLRSSITDEIFNALLKSNESDRSKTVGHDSPTVRVSSVGACVRMNWAKRNSMDVGDGGGFPGRLYSLFALGDKVEDLVVEHLRLRFKVSDEQKEVRFKTQAGELVGHIDGVILYEGERMLLEIKSANDRQYGLCVDQGYEKWNAKYASQIHCYMAGIVVNEAIVVVYNKNTSDIYCEQITYDSSVFEKALCDTEDIMREGVPPERPAEAKNQSCPLCKYCDYKTWCWGPTSSVVWDD